MVFALAGPFQFERHSQNFMFHIHSNVACCFFPLILMLLLLLVRRRCDILCVCVHGSFCVSYCNFFFFPKIKEKYKSWSTTVVIVWVSNSILKSSILDPSPFRSSCFILFRVFWSSLLCTHFYSFLFTSKILLPYKRQNGKKKKNWAKVNQKAILMCTTYICSICVLRERKQTFWIEFFSSNISNTKCIPFISFVSYTHSSNWCTLLHLLCGEKKKPVFKWSIRPPLDSQVCSLRLIFYSGICFFALFSRLLSNLNAYF